MVLPLSAEDPAPAKGGESKPLEIQKSEAKDTIVKRDGMFEITLSGNWKVKEEKMMDLGGGKTMYPGTWQSAGAGLAYFVFVDSTKKTSEMSLERLQSSVVQPIHDKMLKSGGKEESKFMTALNPDNEDQAYFVCRIKVRTAR
jgi:hypothetical protein